MNQKKGVQSFKKIIFLRHNSEFLIKSNYSSVNQKSLTKDVIKNQLCKWQTVKMTNQFGFNWYWKKYLKHAQKIKYKWKPTTSGITTIFNIYIVLSASYLLHKHHQINQKKERKVSSRSFIHIEFDSVKEKNSLQSRKWLSQLCCKPQKIITQQQQKWIEQSHRHRPSSNTL